MVKTNSITTSRPPVVALMGHIDHGKTSLLDRIRQSRLQNKEAGGITQHVGAYQVVIGEQKITFIDTPGHKAFENMRARGAKITDLVVLVIAADEGIKPQTKECLEHIKNVGVPFLIALNKTDLPGVNQEEVKNKLTQFGIVTEDRGGDVILVPVSAKTGQGIDELLEMIVLLAQMNDLDYFPEKPFLGVVLEASVDAQRGVLVTAIVKQGRLMVGQEITSQEEKIKVRALFDDSGQSIKEAFISQPVSILGFVDQPSAGSLVGDPVLMSSRKGQGQENRGLDIAPQEGILLNLVVKADTQGTLEALMNSLPKGEIAVIKSGVGDINDSDIFLASSGGAEIIGFNVSLSRQVADLAKAEGVNVKNEKIIYQILQYIEEKLKTLETIEKEEKVVGQAQIIADFMVPDGRVAGVKVILGEIISGVYVVVVDQKGIEKKTKIASLQQGRERVDRVEKNQDCGVLFSPSVDFKVGDMIKYYQS
ncbi:MAG: translation initiation factor IF-2 [Candidatus Shapirobacteria bacterium]|nr:translation initiation factor IF-2 [Candidatus Shapirobacteria bacterium]MDD5073680.1 translation initiation factor IF-2 [Candidatus Shapirobacteria bacterium]MDD5481442.1 translation initiation factor IF-2 [Candidatus Shapirobacteria bacterium]